MCVLGEGGIGLFTGQHEERQPITVEGHQEVQVRQAGGGQELLRYTH